jgi:hypothetical protein
MLELNINATQFTGIACFSATSAISLLASTVRASRRIWLCIALLYGALAFEVVTSKRHDLTNLARTVMKQNELSSVKESIQLMFIGCSVFAVTFAIFALIQVWRRYKLPERVACFVTVALCSIFFTEIISLHATDAILYQSAHGVLVIGYLWGACAALICTAAMVRLRQPSLLR